MSDTIVNEEKVSLLELLQEAGGVLHNPILRAIIEATSSPDDAFSYVADLGWGANMARKVRLAVRARKKIPREIWEKEYVSTRRPAEMMFKFQCFTPPLVDTYFPTMNTKYSAAVRFGDEEVSCVDWPFFLKEFWLKEGVGSGVITTVDWKGEGFLCSCHATSLQDPKLWNSGSGSPPVLYSKPPGQGQEYAIRKTEPEGSMFYCYWSPGAHISSQIRQVAMPHEKFPRFYKAVEVHKEVERGGWPEYEGIKILFRMDFHPSGRSGLYNDVDGRGEVWYERGVWISQTAKVLLQLRYVITRDLCLGLDKPERHGAHLNYLTIALSPCWPPSGYPNFNDSAALLEPMSELGKQLVAMLERAYRSGPLITLESVAGFSLVEKPPERLADLFC